MRKVNRNKNTKMRKVIRNQEDIFKNIKQYDVDLDSSVKIQSRAKFHRNWYVYQDGADIYFGPSKYIGYLDMNAKSYFSNTLPKDGRVTDKILEAYGTPIVKGSAQFQKLYEKFTKLLSSYGITPNKLTNFHVINANPTINMATPDDEDKLVKLIMEVIGQLSLQQRNTIKAFI